MVAKLHEMGELDDRLKVMKREVLIEEEFDVDDHNRKAGSKKRRRFYLKETLPELQLVPSSGPVFLHSIQLELVAPHPSPKHRPHHPEQDPGHLGLLSSSPWPLVGPFFLHSPSGQLQANVTLVGEIQMSPELLEKCTDFHKYVFFEVLKLTDMMEYLGGGVLVVPLLPSLQLDAELLESLKEPSALLDLAEWKQSVIFPTYRQPKEHFYIEEVVDGLGPKDLMPGGKETFQSYYKRQYGLEVGEQEQPLLRISSAGKRPDMLHPLPGGQARQDLEAATLLLPSLVLVERLGGGLWRQAQALPWVLHRLGGLLGARGLASKLGDHDGERVLKTVLEEPQSLHKLCTFEQLLDRRWRGEQPDAWHLLEAITLRGAGDVMDMERLEVLGDAFLKISTSVFLYYKSLEPGDEEYRHKDEGELSQERAALVSNLHLFRLGTKLGLPLSMVAARLEPHLSWKPPGYSRQALDHRLIKLDARFPSVVQPELRKQLGVGSLLQKFRLEDIRNLQDCESMVGRHRDIISKAAPRKLMLSLRMRKSRRRPC